MMFSTIDVIVVPILDFNSEYTCTFSLLHHSIGVMHAGVANNSSLVLEEDEFWTSLAELHHWMYIELNTSRVVVV
jgi:hypothetical protein